MPWHLACGAQPRCGHDRPPRRLGGPRGHVCPAGAGQTPPPGAGL